MDSWKPSEVIVFSLLLMLVVIGLSNRGLIPYVNPSRGLKGARTPLKGKW
jgi:hypothetical protein